MPTIKIAYLYEDLMNTYGDAGDVKILRYFLKKKNYACSVQNVSLGDDFNAFDYDLVFCGGGQDLEQTVVAKDFLRHKQTLTDYIEDDRLYLGICGGYQFLGSYYLTSNNDRIECLNILPFHTIFNPEKRMIGDTHCTTAYGEVKAFENHSGQTFFDDDNLQPFGKMIEGYGNNPEDGVDGVAYKSVLCSYSHGPLLKNTNVATVLADKMIANYLKYRA